MSDRTEFLMFGRRMHSALRRGINDGDFPPEKKAVEQPRFAHHACAIYLIGALAYLEGTYGRKSWSQPGQQHKDIDAFVAGFRRDSFRKASISSATIEAMVCIRDAIVHNGSDLAKNKNKGSLARVKQAQPSLSGVSLNGSVVTLCCDGSVDFMEQVRKAYVAVCMHHGDG